jgi:hypothetical protein
MGSGDGAGAGTQTLRFAGEDLGVSAGCAVSRCSGAVPGCCCAIAHTQSGANRTKMAIENFMRTMLSDLRGLRAYSTGVVCSSRLLLNSTR